MAGDENEQFESLEDLKRAWREGEPAKTVGPKDLNQRAKSIVDAATRRLDHLPAPIEEGWRIGPVPEFSQVGSSSEKTEELSLA